MPSFQKIASLHIIEVIVKVVGVPHKKAIAIDGKYVPEAPIVDLSLTTIVCWVTKRSHRVSVDRMDR